MSSLLVERARKLNNHAVEIQANPLLPKSVREAIGELAGTIDMMATELLRLKEQVRALTLREAPK